MSEKALRQRADFIEGAELKHPFALGVAKTFQ
jgi:hypothetical protein